MAGILSIQYNPKIGDKQKNLEIIKDNLERNSDKELDLVLMPEFFSTGISDKAFKNEPEPQAGGAVIEYLKELAVRYNTNIISGTVIEKVDDNYYNTSFAINRKGEVVGKYRKIHLYNYMGGNEGELITPGEETVVVNFDFAKVGMAICFDIRYPLLFNKLAKSGAEIIVLPTAWVVPNEVYQNNETKKYACDMWVSMLRTRAYDNMVFFVVSDQVGHTNSFVSTLGSSLIISPTAQILADAEDKECSIYAQIEVDDVKYLKAQYPITSID